MRRRQKTVRRRMSEKYGMLTRQLQKNNIETGRGYWAGIFIKDNYLSGRHRAIKRDASKPCSGTFGSRCMRLQAKPGLHVK